LQLQLEARMDLLPGEIERHYLQSEERQRLSAGQGELERLRTQAILARELPPAPAVVFDIGGGAGVYSFLIARQGYEVHLIDPVELHLEQARSHASASGIALASIALGDARKLDIPSASADAILLLGPPTISQSMGTACGRFAKPTAFLNLQESFSQRRFRVSRP
jgi:SAM-dependent methyltransferase